ncbi:hypothetical protein [Haloechinothrix sp. LS1_15]|uniref:hypothetical protein n=1 Tax=Haloechinothrix sp. LS1_15 TaxID=2652248 RepID=UPI00294B5382|nr:hypothetical protein [Haloechinothrix sp. LS1_15]
MSDVPQRQRCATDLWRGRDDPREFGGAAFVSLTSRWRRYFFFAVDFRAVVPAELDFVPDRVLDFVVPFDVDFAVLVALGEDFAVLAREVDLVAGFD